MSRNIQEVFWLTSADRLQLLHISPAFETVWGYPRENLYTYPGGYWALIVDSIHPIDKERVVTAFSQHYQDEYTAEYRIVRSDGEIRWVRSRCFPVQNSYGETWGIAGLSEDITECKQTEELREREKRFRSVFEFAPVGIATCNQQGMFLQANQAFQEILGYTEAELQTLTFRELTHPDDLAMSVKLFQELLTGKCPHVSQENRYFRKDNCLVWGNLSISGIYDTNGVFEYSIVMLQDVSERKQAHLDLQKAHKQLEGRVVERTALLKQANTLLLQEIAEHKQAQKALKAQKEFLQTVIDINPHPMFIKDRQDNFLLVNQAFADFYGLTVEDLVAKTNTDFHSNHPEVEKFLCQDRTVLETWQPQIVFETRITSPIGAVHYFQIIKKPFLSSDGQAQLVVGVGTDITERKLVEDALRESEQRYRLLIEGMNDGVILVDDNGMLSYVNEKLAEMLGYSPSEMIGHHKSEFLDDANLKIVEEQTARRRRGESGSYELGLKKKNGQPLLTIASGTPIQGEDDSFKGSFKVITDITALKTVQAELQQAKEQLRAVLDAVPGFVSWITSEGRYLGVNQNLADSFNLSPDAFIGKELGFMKNSPSFVHLMQQFLASAAQTGRQVIEVQVNDSTRNYLIVAQKYNQGTQAVSVGIDITERKQAEEALKNSQERLKLAQTVGKIGSWEWNLQTHEIIWTEELEAVYGLAPGSFDGNYETWLQTLHPDDRSRIEQDSGGSITEGREFNSEFRIFWPDGSLHWIAAKFQAFNDDTGKPWRVIGVNMDITDRKQADEALRQSEERFRIAQDLSLDAFTIMHSVRDAAGEIIDFEWDYVNPKAAEILQSTIKDLKGHRLLQVLPGNKTNSELFGRYVQVVETGIPHDIEISYNSEGITGWFRNMAVKLNDGIVVSFSDITSRKQAEVERINLLEREKAARTQAEAANRIKDEFLAVLSHELRSPLNPILGWSKLLQSRKFDEATTARALEIIERNAKLQIQLIEDLLDVSRILRGKLSLNIYPVNLVPTIEAALETVRLAASAKSIQIKSVYEPNVGQVSGDSGRLQQVIWNLLSNAVKFTPQGGCVEIRLSVVSSQSQRTTDNGQRTTDKYAQIQVSDTGKGINPDFLPHVFDYFRQENSTTTRLFGGLGLGLAIVRHLVELHGGTVCAESPGEGQGATFTVQLPLMITQPETNPDNQQFNESPNLRGIRVLVVDDEADMREFLAFMLEEYGAKVTVVASASEALEALCQVKPDVLVSDIGMPEVDGYMLIRQIRAMPPEQGGLIPAIALTAYAGEADQNQALSAGFHKHIAKPVEPNELATVIASVAIGNSNV